MKGISLSSVIQVINLERQSCDISAAADGQTGQLHFRDGALVDAVSDDLAGEAAAYEILGWENPEFEVNTEDSPRDRTIDADLTQLLLETARRQDEDRAGLTTVAAADGSGEVFDFAAAEADDRPAPPLEFAQPAGKADPPTRAGDSPPVAVAPEPLAAAATQAAPAPLAAVEPAPAPHIAAVTTPDAVAPPAAASAGTFSAANLKRVIDIARDGIGDALLSADVYSSADGTSFVGVNSQPAACALINQITERMTWSLGKSGLPGLGRYYMAELDEGKMLLVAPCGPIQLDLIVDTSRVQLGLLLNVILPEVISALEAASPA